MPPKAGSSGEWLSESPGAANLAFLEPVLAPDCEQNGKRSARVATPVRVANEAQQAHLLCISETREECHDAIRHRDRYWRFFAFG
jgi:hypothetical protein